MVAMTYRNSLKIDFDPCFSFSSNIRHMICLNKSPFYFNCKKPQASRFLVDLVKTLTVCHCQIVPGNVREISHFKLYQVWGNFDDSAKHHNRILWFFALLIVRQGFYMPHNHVKNNSESIIRNIREFERKVWSPSVLQVKRWFLFCGQFLFSFLFINDVM